MEPVIDAKFSKMVFEERLQDAERRRFENRVARANGIVDPLTRLTNWLKSFSVKQEETTLEPCVEC